MEEQKELKLVSKVEVGKIETNCKEIKPFLEQIVKEYKDKVFEESDIKLAKKDVAKLRKLKEAINTRKKDIKRDYLAPLSVAETAFKELMAMLDEPIGLINTQVTNYNDRVKAEKQAAIDEKIAILLEDSPIAEFIISCEFFFDPRWLNTTVKMPSIEKDIMAKIGKITEDFKQISQSEFLDRLSSEYRQSGNLGAVLNMQARLTEEKERNLRIKAAQEAARIPFLAPDIVEASPEPEETHTITVKFAATGSTEAMIALGKWCRENGIELRRI